jgi:hypothetical protein
MQGAQAKSFRILFLNFELDFFLYLTLMLLRIMWDYVFFLKALKAYLKC